MRRNTGLPQGEVQVVRVCESGACGGRARMVTVDAYMVSNILGYPRLPSLRRTATALRTGLQACGCGVWVGCEPAPAGWQMRVAVVRFVCSFRPGRQRHSFLYPRARPRQGQPQDCICNVQEEEP